LGSRNERVVRQLEPLVKEINALEGWAQGLSAEECRAQTEEFKRAVQAGETTLDEVLPKAFALVREASVRTLGMRHFDVQLVGGAILHEGAIAEMMTGEGKTLVATLPLYLNALTGRSVYLVTVNDYLARRDGAWMAPIYEYLGLTVGSIQSEMGPQQRLPIYACDIVYGTNNEFGFDYLRDNMKTRVEDQVQRHLQYAIVDEVDSILIDEARTPLIISGPAEQDTDKYKLADQVARQLKAEEHYEVKEKERSASLLEAGIEEAQRIVGVESFYEPPHQDWPHYIENALRAHSLYENDKQYIVDNGEVVIVDEHTGRKMSGRRWSDGLHQAVETKEGLQVRQENQTLATITFQNYFRMYDKLAGMTGTAITEAGEFHKIYEMDVVVVPTNLPLARDDGNDVVYRTEKEKWQAITDELDRVHEKGQPVLVGTTSVETSEKLAGMLKRRGIKHEVLNAKQHEREANIVACAGEKGAITVATNMAGRGTDIKLGGNFEYRLNQALEQEGLELGDLEHLTEIDKIRDRLREQCEKDEAEVLALGGLYVLGTERHEARRIDNQLRGRSGRQGNVGESRFFLSLQDDLMRIFYRDWVTNAMEKLGMTEGQEIESGMVTRAIARAQKKVEERNFEIRKSLLEYDGVMDEQRREIYSTRQDVLENVELKKMVTGMLEGAMWRNSQNQYVNDPEGFSGWFERMFGFEAPADAVEVAVDPKGDVQGLMDVLMTRYTEREKEFGEELMPQVERYILLNAIDSRWKDHLHAVDSLKAGIGLRGYGQVDPKTEFKREGMKLFDSLKEVIEDEVTSLILRIQVRREPPPPTGMGPGEAGGPGGPGAPGGPGGVSPEAARARAAQMAARRRAQSSMVPASRAFDAMKRRQAIAAAQQGTATAEKPEDESSEQASSSSSAPSAGGKAEKQPQAKESQEDAAAYEGVGRNDACPCGSGQKFKKCHGKAG
jgi:preprotein translocase subunit SecA